LKSRSLLPLALNSCLSVTARMRVLKVCCYFIAYCSLPGAMLFVRRQMSLGCDPRSVLRTLLPNEADSDIPDDLDDMTLWRLIISLVSAPPRRHRLVSVSTLDDVVRLLQTCKKIIVLTGAGVSMCLLQLLFLC
jgi:hypothetical protein